MAAPSYRFRQIVDLGAHGRGGATCEMLAFQADKKKIKHLGTSTGKVGETRQAPVEDIPRARGEKLATVFFASPLKTCFFFYIVFVIN